MIPINHRKKIATTKSHWMSNSWRMIWEWKMTTFFDYGLWFTVAQFISICARFNEAMLHHKFISYRLLYVSKSRLETRIKYVAFVFMLTPSTYSNSLSVTHSSSSRFFRLFSRFCFYLFHLLTEQLNDKREYPRLLIRLDHHRRSIFVQIKWPLVVFHVECRNSKNGQTDAKFALIFGIVSGILSRPCLPHSLSQWYIRFYNIIITIMMRYLFTKHFNFQSISCLIDDFDGFFFLLCLLFSSSLFLCIWNLKLLLSQNPLLIHFTNYLLVHTHTHTQS